MVAVSARPQDPELLDVLDMDATDYDVVFVASMAHAYARIKHVVPDAVIVYLEADDVAACQLLSMLKVDRATSDIPVMTWETVPA